MSDWFAADKRGLRHLGERLVSVRGVGILGAELYQNVMDTNATVCNMSITPIEGRRGLAHLVVEDDDPEGFTDLTHAYTVFAPSKKRFNPELAGRFNLGEKCVLAFCREATITTTTGTVHFSDKGRTVSRRKRREQGSCFEALVDITKAQCQEFVEYMHRIIVKPGLRLVCNGEDIPHREPLKVLDKVALRTQAGENLSPTTRQTTVAIFEPLPGEVPTLYELGIPVVELPQDKYHVSVGQKVPLNMDRDNVTPAYLRDIRTVVFNAMHQLLSSEDIEAGWINEATSSEECDDSAIKSFLDLRFGRNRVAQSVRDPESNARAVANGEVVIPPRALTRGQRDNAKKADALPNAHDLYPTPKPFSDDPDAPRAEIVPESEWTSGMRYVAAYSKWLAKKLLREGIQVQIYQKFNGRAAYGGRCLSLSLAGLGKDWFTQSVGHEHDALLIHEFGHEFAANHLSEEYYRSLCRLGARLKQLAIEEPEAVRAWMEGRGLAWTSSRDSATAPAGQEV